MKRILKLGSKRLALITREEEAVLFSAKEKSLILNSLSLSLTNCFASVAPIDVAFKEITELEGLIDRFSTIRYND